MGRPLTAEEIGRLQALLALYQRALIPSEENDTPLPPAPRISRVVDDRTVNAFQDWVMRNHEFRLGLPDPPFTTEHLEALVQWLPLSNIDLAPALRTIQELGLERDPNRLNPTQLSNLEAAILVVSQHYGIEGPLNALSALPPNRGLRNQFLRDAVSAIICTPEAYGALQVACDIDYVTHRSPVDEVIIDRTDDYGMRFHPIYERYMPHTGVDFEAPPGQRTALIRASATGDVVRYGHHRDYGNYMVLRHDDGTYSFYAHLQSIRVDRHLLAEGGTMRWASPSDRFDQALQQEPVNLDRHGMPLIRIMQGEPIGLMGQSGRATGVHLHYEQFVSMDMEALERGVIRGVRRFPVFSNAVVLPPEPVRHTPTDFSGWTRPPLPLEQRLTEGVRLFGEYHVERLRERDERIAGDVGKLTEEAIEAGRRIIESWSRRDAAPPEPRENDNHGRGRGGR